MNLYWVSKPDDNSIRKKVSSAKLKEAYITNTDQILNWPSDCGCQESSWATGDRSCWTTTCITNSGAPDKTIRFDNSSSSLSLPWHKDPYFIMELSNHNYILDFKNWRFLDTTSWGNMITLNNAHATVINLDVRSIINNTDIPFVMFTLRGENSSITISGGSFINSKNITLIQDTPRTSARPHESTIFLSSPGPSGGHYVAIRDFEFNNNTSCHLVNYSSNIIQERIYDNNENCDNPPDYHHPYLNGKCTLFGTFTKQRILSGDNKKVSTFFWNGSDQTCSNKNAATKNVFPIGLCKTQRGGAAHYTWTQEPDPTLMPDMSLIIVDSVISDNSGSTSPIINTTANYIFLQKVVFEENYTEGSGGLIYIYDNVHNPTTIKCSGSVKFNNNYAKYGGAIYSDNSLIIVSDPNGMTTFKSNSSSYNGGAIYTEKTITLTDGSFSFQDNTSIKGYGGALSAGGISIKSGDYEFSGNSCMMAFTTCGQDYGPVTKAGGAIYSSGIITLSPTKIVLKDNSAIRPSDFHYPNMGQHIAGNQVKWFLEPSATVSITNPGCDISARRMWSPYYQWSIGAFVECGENNPIFKPKCPPISYCGTKNISACANKLHTCTNDIDCPGQEYCMPCPAPPPSNSFCGANRIEACANQTDANGCVWDFDCSINDFCYSCLLRQKTYNDEFAPLN